MNTNKILTVDGTLFKDMVALGAKKLKMNEEKVNTLNVFPVPDGDTGTNMNLTFSTGVKAMENCFSSSLADVTEAFAKGLLMGARGNSGVILSQLFRGFSKSVNGKETMNAEEFAHALQSGVDMAYKAIMKPVEGTILTVSKDTAKMAVLKADQTKDIIELMEAVVEESNASLKRTKEILPILKQVGVVDSGGQGLVFVYEGMLSFLKGEHNIIEETNHTSPKLPSFDTEDEVAEMMSQGVLSVSDITYGYCTEFMILRTQSTGKEYVESAFREELNAFGDSLLVISDDDLVKVHIHAEKINEVLSIAQSYGELTKIKIENMREQFRTRKNSENVTEKKENGIVAIGTGEGVKDLFLSLGVDYFLLGGQTMNPSTEDIVKAINSVHADTVYVLPNNSNIILAAEQSIELVDKHVVIIPSKTIQQGISAMMSFIPEATTEKNKTGMTRALKNVVSGQVTIAVRDTSIDGVDIQKNEYMGIADGKILLTGKELTKTTERLIETLIQEHEGEVVTVIYGDTVSKEEAENLLSLFDEYDVEWELHYGGQPLYPYLISVE